MARMARRVVVDNRDVEPAALLQQLKIALLVGLLVGEADHIETGRDLDGQTGQRDPARRFRLLHQDAGNVGDAARGEIRR